MKMEKKTKAFTDHLEALYRRKWHFLTPLVIAIVVGAIVAMRLPSFYSSTALIVVEERVPAEDVAAQDRTPFAQKLNVLTQRVMSRAKLERVIAEHGLYKKKDDGLMDAISKKILGQKTADKTPDLSRVVERMRSDIEFKPAGDQPANKRSPGSDAFTVTYTGAEPEQAMKVAQTLVALFIDENSRERQETAQETTDFLSEELERARFELEYMEASIKSYKESNIGSLPEQMTSNLQTKERLQLELQDTLAGLREAEEKKRSIELQLQTGQQIAQRPPDDPVEGEIRTLKSRLVELRSMYKDNYPDIVITANRLAELEKQRPKKSPGDTAPAQAVDPRVYDIETRIQTLKRREFDTREQIRDLDKMIAGIPANEQRQANLYRDYTAKQANYQNLLGRKMNANLALNLEKRFHGARFTLIDPPSKPVKETRPQRPVVLAMALALGGTCGVGLVIMAEFMNPAIRKPEELSDIEAGPLLACIPDFNARRPAEKKA